MKYMKGLILLLALTSSAFGAELKLPETARGEPGDFIKVPAVTTGLQVRWVALDRGLAVFPVELLKDSKTAIVTAKAAGTYRLLAYTSDKDGPSDPAYCTVIVGEPTPPVPPGPGPGPGPTPPGPTPAPIPADGLHVLILFSAGAKLPKDQEMILNSGKIQDYLDSKCPVGPDGKTHEWRIWDYDTGTAGETKLWTDAAARKPAKDKLPWIIISNPQKGGGYEGPLPATIADALTLLQKYGG